jgi:zinc transport system ATP-binding protein
MIAQIGLEADREPEVISVEHLWAGYGGDIVLEDINLSVRKRDFVGIIGPNGGGKTTLFRVLLGLLEPLAGRVRILGRSVKQARGAIGYVPQRIDFDRDFPISVWEVTLMGRLRKRPLLRRYDAEDQAIVTAALRTVGLLDLSRRSIGELSGGQRQRVYIARALAAEPQILLLDEPTSSIDPEASVHVYDVLAELNQQLTIIMVSHDISAISTYVKSIGCLSRKLFYEGEKHISEATLAEAYQCPVDLIAHGVPHRVLPHHSHDEEVEP